MFTPTKEAEMINRIIFQITRNGMKIRASLKKIVCLSLIFLLLISFLNLNINKTNSLEHNEYINKDKNNLIDNLRSAIDPSILKPPYLNNFNDVLIFRYQLENTSYGIKVKVQKITIFYKFTQELIDNQEEIKKKKNSKLDINNIKESYIRLLCLLN